MSYEVKQGNLFGRIGEGFGKGLAEQVPQEVERYRLSQGLKNFEKNSQTQNPLQQAISLYQIPGMNEEKTANLIRLSEEANARRQAIEQGQGSKKPPDQNNPSVAKIPFENKPQEEIPKRTGKKSIVQPETERAMQTPILPPTIPQIKARSAELMTQFPQLYKTPAQGEAAAEAEFNRENAQKQAFQTAGQNQQALASQVKSAFDERLGKKLQKNGTETYSDVLGDIQNNFLNDAEDAVASGKMTSKEAGDHYSNEALDLAKSLGNLRALGEKSIWTGSRSANKQAIDEVRKKFEKLNHSEEFKDFLISSQDLSSPYASNIAFPITNNKEITSEYSKIKPSKYHTTSTEGIEERKFADKISKMIGEKDSLQTIALRLQEKNLDPQIFMTQIKNLYDDGKISLNKRQAREFEKGTTFIPSWGDMYLYSFTGLEPLETLR